MANVPNFGGFWQEPDFLLMNLVSLLANKLESDLGVTLLVGGSIITGTLVSERYYLYSLGEILRNVGRAPMDIPPDIVDLVADALGVEDYTEDDYPDMYTEEDDEAEDESEAVTPQSDGVQAATELTDSADLADDEEDDLPPAPPLLQHLHLKDPVWIYPNTTVRFGQSQLPVIRLRLASIDGWMFGRINISPFDEDIPNIGLIQ
ncbi:MAG: hypothetical protein J0M07_27810 [Anaerolineae bacterium]|nr:hypothetical protein [Anaerolineae bacterium]